MSEIVFFLEERSAEAMLEGLLPRLLQADTRYRCIVFEGKQDLEKQLPKRMRGYRVPGARFVVLRDQDSEVCQDVKTRLTSLCRDAGHPDCLVRIACRELESWYLADLQAVQKGLGMERAPRLPHKRSSDTIHNPARELARIAPSYQKVGGSRSIGPFLDLTNRQSYSFAVFIDGVKRVLAEIAAARA